MKFETLKKSHKKEIIIGVSIIILIGIVLIIKSTFAKYELVKNIKIAEGTINYKVPDFKVMAMYKNDGNGYTEIETMPDSGYAINEEKSYCTLDNVNKDEKAKLFTNEDGKHIISGLSKNSKCYLYFDKEVPRNIVPEIISPVNSGTPDFSKVATVNEGLFKAQDNDGDTYYFRGAIDNNYIKFANKWWRIIRINGDGSIRLIYDGTEPHANGTITSDSIAVANQTFSPNGTNNDNMYVGLKYTSGQVHGLENKSNALTQLEIWYENNLSSYATKIDTNAGFCGDREPSTSYTTINGSGGTETTTTYYGANIRLYRNRTPELTCANTSDLYTISTSTKGNKSLTYPIGLITADEASMAGGVREIANSSYYLYNGQYYWTLSPSRFYNMYAGVYMMHSNGELNANTVSYTYGLRPVINLKADTLFTGKGTITNPYIVY